MEKGLVSFIMGVYNTKKKEDLDRSIENMLNQTYKNVEVVICDDCSTNGIYEYLVEKYGKNPQITILRSEKNSGGAAIPRNTCIKHAKGEYIAVQDDDDYSSIDRIEKQVAFLEANPDYALVSAGLKKFDDKGIWGCTITKEYPTKRDFKHGNQHVHAATLFRASCLQEVGCYRVAKETIRAEDYDLFIRMYANGMKGYNIQEALYFYNTPREGSKHSKYKHRYYESIVRRKGFKALKLPLRDRIYVLRPLIVGLLPRKVKTLIKKLLRRK